jgi:hypothetical protein
MNDNPVMMKVRAFEERHGSEKYSDGAAWFYADGAMRDMNPIGILMEPPDSGTDEGEYKMALHKLKFAQLKLQTAVSEFDQLNTRLAHTIPMDPDADLAELKRLAKVVESRKKLVTEAEEGVANTRWGRRRAELRRADEEQRQRMADFNEKRRSIRV